MIIQKAKPNFMLSVCFFSFSTYNYICVPLNIRFHICFFQTVKMNASQWTSEYGNSLETLKSAGSFRK